MEAEADGLLAPTQKSNDIIQIEITRKCDLFHCSNCTRMLPFRKDDVEMTLDCFREAVRSCEGWPGVVALFGGNPCSHSRFPEICEIMREEIPDQRRRGLWTNNLLKHGQVCRDTFFPAGRFNCNAHMDEDAAAEIDKWLPGKLIKTSRNRASWHSPIMLDYRDYGIEESEWVALRERCDINRNWSAAIMQRDGRPYAYFCEVAGAWDGVRGENNGILAVPGWWKFGMDGFGDQVRKCCDRGCGVPLKGKGHLDRDDTYDVSPSLVPLTTKRGKVKIAVNETAPDRTHEATDYQHLRAKVG